METQTLSHSFFETSPETGILDEALAKAQSEMRDAMESAENPHFRSKYADLASIRQACSAALSKHGISVTQWPVPASKPNHVALFTRLAFKGQWMRGYFELPSRTWNAQDAGGAITYLRRYTLAAVTGVAPSDDDDGNSATWRGPEQEPETQLNKQKHTKVQIKPAGEASTAKTESNAPEKAKEPLAFLATSGGAKWSAFWSSARSLGWDSDQVHFFVKDGYGVDSLTKLSDEQLQELKTHISKNPMN